MQRILRPASVFILGVLLSGPGYGQTPRPLSVDPNQATSGDLLWISAAGAVPLPMTEIAVDLRISGMVVDGTLVQHFENTTTETIEVLYVFPLPDDAAVYGMEMRIGERRIVGEVHEKSAAKRAYEDAKQDGRRAALVDQHRPNLFRTTAANIGPGEAIRVELRFVFKATRVGDEYRLRFPLAVMPRYVPEGHEPLSHANLARAPEARILVDLDHGIELERVASPSHHMEQRRTRRSLRLEPATGTTRADRDFLLIWQPARSAMPEVASFVETRGDERYALVLLVPPSDKSALGAGLPTETLFVIDVSGSMKGPSIAQARQALSRALARLRPDDRFNILKFNADTVAFAATFELADAATVERARRWVAALEAGGGTAIYPALDRALQLVGQGSSGLASRVIFLTDGAVANEQEVLRAIADRLGSTRLHTIGIGTAPNAWLMRKMAWHGRGMSEFVATVDHADNRIDAFFDRLERPVWTDLTLAWDGVRADAVTPARLPDLHGDEPLVLTARLDGATGGKLTVGGWSADGWTERAVSLDRGGLDNPGIGRTWARAQIEALMDSLPEGADARAVRERVLDLGLTFRLVTAYTSLVAVETYAGELTDGVATHALPRTGTLEPLKRTLALLFAAAGFLGLLGLRRSA